MTTEQHPIKVHLKIMSFIADKVTPAVWSAGDENLPAPDSSETCVLYINLDSHLDRRKHIESQLDGLGFCYERVPAVSHVYSALGCLKSHIKALRIAKQKGCLWTAVFEDDFSFQCSFSEAREHIKYIHNHHHLAPVWIGDWIVNGPEPLQQPSIPNAKMANGACNNTSCFFVRQDYLDVLLGTWETALTRFVDELEHRVSEKRAGNVSNIGTLWWFNPDAAWAPLQIRDHWLLFEPKLGRQEIEKFGSSITPSYSQFEESGYLEYDLADTSNKT